MPSSLQTRGFDVNVTPGYQLANPTLFNAGAPLAQGFSSGTNMAAQVQDMMLKKKAEQDNEQVLPLRLQLMQAEVTRAQQQQHLSDIEMPGKEIMAKQPIKIKQSEFLDLDDEGNLQKYGSFKIIDPTTGEVGYQPRGLLGTVKTKQQLEDDKANAEALRTYRQGLGEAAQTKAATAAQIAAWKQANPTVKTKTFFDKDLNVFEQVVNADGTLGAAVQVLLPNGQPAKKPASQMDGLAAALGALAGPGANPTATPTAGATPSPSAQMPAAGVTGNLDALGNLANQFAAQPKVFANEAAAAAAANAGLIKHGDRIVVAGVSGTWQH